MDGRNRNDYVSSLRKALRRRGVMEQTQRSRFWRRGTGYKAKQRRRMGAVSRKQTSHQATVGVWDRGTPCTGHGAVHRLDGVRLVAVGPRGRWKGRGQRGAGDRVRGAESGLGGDEGCPQGWAEAVEGGGSGGRESQQQDPQPTGHGWLDQILGTNSGEQLPHNTGVEEAGLLAVWNIGQEGVEDDIHGRREGHPAAEELGEKPNVPDARPPVRSAPVGAAARVDHQDAQIAFDALEIGDEGDLQPQEDEEVGVQKRWKGARDGGVVDGGDCEAGVECP